MPTVVDSGAGAGVELGVKFTSNFNGTITGLRFYKSTANTGTHIGNLWSSTGTLLATDTFTNETDSGWQQVNFSIPVAITANTVYVCLLYTSSSVYATALRRVSIRAVRRALRGHADSRCTRRTVTDYVNAPPYQQRTSGR